ncbi:MAG: hypothetical protein A4E53_04365 [Pelotomaculum sp. PtaB.Bin104]|nr:MAG: hypothetical protein A4E53_04365 [Pelotomaculum sp. PtaB.Bin104]
MKGHTGDIKGYLHLSRRNVETALKSQNYVDKISFGYFDNDGIPIAEMTIKWHNIGTIDKPIAKLEVYENAFYLLEQFKDLINLLAKVDSEEYIQPKVFCKKLTEFGFKNLS